jgi:outer membrane protein OmpA-like peptidoglycan-associated protein
MKKTLLLLTICASALASFAQDANNRWGIGAGLGFTDFVNPINGQYLMVERWKGAANLNIQRYLGKSFDGRLNMTFGNAFYPYAKNQPAANQTVPTTINLAQKGNMEYQNAQIIDGGLNLVYKFANGSILKEDAKFAPFLFSGIGVNAINKIGSTTNGGNNGGAGNDQINPYIPVGLGFNLGLGSNWSASAEAAYKFALGEAFNYVALAFRLNHNFGGGAVTAAAASTTAAAAAAEPGANENWCNYNWKIGVGANFNSFEAVQRAQNFILEDYTTSLGLNVTKYVSRMFDLRANLGFGNVFYAFQPGASQPFDGDNWKGTSGGTMYRNAQMIDLNLQPVFKFANGSMMAENAIFSPYVYAGPGLNYITSIGNWNNYQNGPKAYGTDDVNIHLGTGLGFNFRTSDKFSIQMEGGRNWRMDNSYSYNQAALRGVVALGECAGAPTKKSKADTKPTTIDSDNDGIPDLTDECPYVAGKAEFFGCPDSDGDGIGDSKDKCPFEAGVASNGGCPEIVSNPDTDADGVLDVNDKCPDVAGPASNNGCPAATNNNDNTKNNNSTSSNKNAVGSYEVFFSGCNTLSAGQIETLQTVATMLKNNPNYRVEIGGNSAKGTSAACAQQRADKIAAILKMKGVNVNTAKRISYGAKRPKYNNSQDNRADITIYSLD